jgi:hypothetical protein
VPQLRQNFLPAAFAVPQTAHSITGPRSLTCAQP